MSKKPYTEELAEWVRSRSQRPPDTDRVALLALRDDIQAALRAGYSRKTIWQHFRDTGRTTLRYETFLRYLRRHIQPAPASPPDPKPKPLSPPSPSRGFPFNPVPPKGEPHLMPNVHWLLQGKGGVGKSLISAWLAQFKIAQGPCAALESLGALASAVPRENPRATVSGSSRSATREHCRHLSSQGSAALSRACLGRPVHRSRRDRRPVKHRLLSNPPGTNR
jgi:hypothetical protein